MIASLRTPRTSFPELKRAFDRRAQAAALKATDRAAKKLKERHRSEMAAAGLGKLGMALGSGSDLEKGGRVHRGPDGWSVSGWVYVRSGSKRSRGALQAYTEGASITPKNSSGLLWFPTDDIMRMARVPLPSSAGNARANVRLTPKLWRRTYEARFGKLFRLPGTNLLAVKNATLSLAGKPRSIKPLTKRGKVPKGQIAKEFVIAFIGIPQTSRAARVNPETIARKVLAELGRDFTVTMKSGAQ